MWFLFVIVHQFETHHPTHDLLVIWQSCGFWQFWEIFHHKMTILTVTVTSALKKLSYKLLTQKSLSNTFHLNPTMSKSDKYWWSYEFWEARIAKSSGSSMEWACVYVPGGRVIDICPHPALARWRHSPAHHWQGDHGKALVWTWRHFLVSTFPIFVV